MDLKETTGLASVYLEAKTSSIVFVGTASSLRSANLLIESLLEDVRQLSANDEKEKELMNELYGYNKKVCYERYVPALLCNDVQRRKELFFCRVFNVCCW